MSSEVCDDEYIEDALTNEVNDIDTISSNGDAVEVGDEKTSIDEDGIKYEIKEEPNEELVRVSVSEAVMFYANLLNMGKQCWGNISNGKLNNPGNKCVIKFANMVITTRKSEKKEDKGNEIVKTPVETENNLEDAIVGLKSWSMTDELAEMDDKRLNIISTP